MPRYTSYPTAPHFSPAVSAGAYASWLSALPTSATLSLYLHVPYCAQLCHYCGCHTKAVRRRGPIEAYADQLASEIAMIGSRIGRHRVVHLHWGGGTPSILGEKRIAALTGNLEEAFDIAADCEQVIELDPRYVTRELARFLSSIGINRVSLGVQELAAHVQSAIGRIQSFGMIERAVLELRESGIDDINFDLMYGLPRQTVEDVRCSAISAIGIASCCSSGCASKASPGSMLPCVSVQRS